MRTPRLVVPALIVVSAVALVFAACDDSGPSSSSTRVVGTPASGTVTAPAAAASPHVTLAAGERELRDGDSIGKIEHSAGGTAVARDAQVLASALCAAGKLSLRTDREAVSGDMDCDRMLPDRVISTFVGKPIAISYANGRLKIESESAGTFELPVSAPVVKAANAAP